MHLSQALIRSTMLQQCCILTAGPTKAPHQDLNFLLVLDFTEAFYNQPE